MNLAPTGPVAVPIRPKGVSVPSWRIRRRYYRVARPSLREISKAVDDHEDPRVKKVTASAETVRRMITGKVLPEQARLYAVFRVLCDTAEVDPDAEHWAALLALLAPLAGQQVRAS